MYEDDLEKPPTNTEVAVATVVTVTLGALVGSLFHYTFALGLRLFGVKAPVNPRKVIPTYAGITASGIGALYAMDAYYNNRRQS